VICIGYPDDIYTYMLCSLENISARLSTYCPAVGLSFWSKILPVPTAQIPQT
jgi:hypothetical protein